MRIEGLPPAMLQALLSAASPKIERAAGTLAVAPEVMPAPAPVPPASLPATSVQMLVAMAAVVPPSEERRRKAVETDRGLTMLERLNEALVAGVVPPEQLRELADWSASFEAPDDPALSDLARDVELRVRVELAKHELRA